MSLRHNEASAVASLEVGQVEVSNGENQTVFLKSDSGEKVCSLVFKVTKDQEDTTSKHDFEPNALKQSPDKHETDKHNEYNDHTNF